MNFISLDRVCVPICMSCNLQCRYCMRDINKIEDIPITNIFKEFVSNLHPKTCDALIVTGGEPLTAKERMLEIFECARNKLHRKIITNGTLIDEDFVKYVNKNQIEVALSHDGECTEYLRGKDVFKDPSLLKLIRKIDFLSVGCTLTNLNPNVLKNLDYIQKTLHRKDFLFIPIAVFETGHNAAQIEGFNYSEFESSLMEYRMTRDLKNISTFYKSDYSLREFGGLNVLPNGDVVGMSTLHKYGHITEEKSIIKMRRSSHPDLTKCKNSTCNLRGKCQSIEALASPHYCKIERIRQNISAYYKLRG